MSTNNNFDLVPIDVLVEIFSFLDFLDLISCGATSREMRLISSLPCVWRVVCLRRFCGGIGSVSRLVAIRGGQDWRGAFLELHGGARRGSIVLDFLVMEGRWSG